MSNYFSHKYDEDLYNDFQELKKDRDFGEYEYEPINRTVDEWVEIIKDGFKSCIWDWAGYIDNPKGFYENADIKSVYRDKCLYMFSVNEPNKKLFLETKWLEAQEIALEHIPAEELNNPEDPDDMNYWEDVVEEWQQENEKIILKELGFTDDEDNYYQNRRQIKEAFDEIPYTWFEEQFANFFDVEN